MANSKDHDQTAEKVIAFICFNFMNKNVWMASLFFSMKAIDKTFADKI